MYFFMNKWIQELTYQTVDNTNHPVNLNSGQFLGKKWQTGLGRNTEVVILHHIFPYCLDFYAKNALSLDFYAKKTVLIFLLKKNIKEIILIPEESFHNNFISYVALFLKTGIPVQITYKK